MCGISLEKLQEIVTDQDHEEFLEKLQAAVDKYNLTLTDDYLL